MAAIDIPALTRGISGLFTADAEGKRAAEDRAKEQQSQAMVDFLRQSQARDLQQRGRDRRERLVLEKQQAAEKKAQREAAATQLASQNAADEDVILGQLKEPFDREGKSHTFVMREARRRLAIQNRVPRAGTKPPKDPAEVQAEEREKAILAERVRILRDNPGMSEPDVMRQATERIDQRQFLLESDIRIKDLNAGGQAPPSQAQEPTSSDDDLSQARQMIQGLDPATARQELTTAGFTEDEITRILGN